MKKGFTLIELMVVLSIIGILVFIILEVKDNDEFQKNMQETRKLEAQEEQTKIAAFPDVSCGFVYGHYSTEDLISCPSGKQYEWKSEFIGKCPSVITAATTTVAICRMTPTSWIETSASKLCTPYYEKTIADVPLKCLDYYGFKK